MVEDEARHGLPLFGGHGINVQVEGPLGPKGSCHIVLEEYQDGPIDLPRQLSHHA